MVPTQGITWLFSCPDIIPNNINLRQERKMCIRDRQKAVQQDRAFMSMTRMELLQRRMQNLRGR